LRRRSVRPSHGASGLGGPFAGGALRLIRYALAGLALAACAEPSAVQSVNIAASSDHPYPH
jgi:hypothetical protein